MPVLTMGLTPLAGKIRYLFDNIRVTACCLSPRNYAVEEAKVNVTIRRPVSADAETCGRIIYEAFTAIADGARGISLAGE